MKKRMNGFGRRYSPDVRDHAFLMARKLEAPGTPLPIRKTWAITSKNLDQGQTGTCVGHAWSNFLRCAPLQTLTGPTPFSIYRHAIVLDEWPDNDNEVEMPEDQLQSGTSVRAGAKAVTNLGRLKSYLWAFNLQPALEFVLTQGPCVLGINYYSSMFTPNAEGIISITKNARVEGGHAILWRGADTKRGLARLSNSWGDGWGLSGDCLIGFKDLERLIHEQGECCSAVEQKLKAVK
jgi:hypothetical protein